MFGIYKGVDASSIMGKFAGRECIIYLRTIGLHMCNLWNGKMPIDRTWE
jgi:hypothetical protein